jgi:hypothetical protein
MCNLLGHFHAPVLEAQLGNREPFPCSTLPVLGSDPELMVNATFPPVPGAGHPLLKEDLEPLTAWDWLLSKTTGSSKKKALTWGEHLIFPDLRDSFLEGSIQEEILQIQENIQNFKHPHVEIHTQFILMSLKRICFKRLTIHMVKYSLIMHRSRGHYIF